MLNYRDTQNALHTRLVDFSLQEYLFVLQTILGEDLCVAYASVFDTKEFKRNVPSENEEDYLSELKADAKNTLQRQSCIHLRELLEQEYQRDVQLRATNLEDFTFTGADAQRILNNILHDRTQNLSEASVRDIVSLLKMMYESGSLDSGDTFQKHFVVVPNKYSILCPNCNREGYAVEGLDFRCEHCGAVAKWDESAHRYYPELNSL